MNNFALHSFCENVLLWLVVTENSKAHKLQRNRNLMSRINMMYEARISAIPDWSEGWSEVISQKFKTTDP